MSQGEAMEIDGVRFTSDEVESVTIRRNGRKITLHPKRRESRLIGFSTEQTATDGNEPDNEPSDSKRSKRRR